MNLTSRKILIAWMTMLMYAASGCAFVNSGHCCSGHSHLDGEAHHEHDHLPQEPGSDDSAASEPDYTHNDFSLSPRHCCGQGIHGEAERIALHVASSQRSTDPYFSGSLSSLRGDDGLRDSLCIHSRTNYALSRATARSPGLESILTVSLLI